MYQLHSPTQVNVHLASSINGEWTEFENDLLQKNLDAINWEDPEDMGSRHKAERHKSSNATQNPFKDVCHFFKTDNEMSKCVKTLLEQKEYSAATHRWHHSVRPDATF